MTLDFVGVGAGKSGTTWVAACLAEHPRVCISRPKELNYFSDYSYFPGLRSNFGRDNPWLAARFGHWRAGQLRGEISPVYMLDPAVPQRLAAHSQKLKLIFSYREPVSRLYSLYFQLRRLYPVPSTFEGFLDSSDAYVPSGCYAQQTARFLQVFPRAQLHFIFYDDIALEAPRVTRELFTFLGVDPGFAPPSSGRRIHERAEPRSAWLRDVLHRIRLSLNRTDAAGAKDMLVRLGAERMYQFLQGVNSRGAPLPPMRPDTRARLAAAYASDISVLSHLTGRDLSHWLNPPK